MQISESNLGLPDTDGLRGLLREAVGKRAYVVPMTGPRGGALGNNGDHIMHQVFLRLLEEFDIDIVSASDSPELVIVPPNGALLEIYQFPELLKERLTSFRKIPVVIFPSSAYFPTQNPAVIFEDHEAPVTWILREKKSFDHLEALWGLQLREAGVVLELDHDVVASGHRFIRDIIRPRKTSLVLVAARGDVEKAPLTLTRDRKSLAKSKRSLAHRLRSAVPYGRVSTFFSRRARRHRQRASSQELLGRLPKQTAEEIRSSRLRQVFSDASAPQFATFSEYAELIARADLIVTNRLHVALPAAALGKRVYLVDAGYHKLSGVYERSLAKAAHVTLVTGPV